MTSRLVVAPFDGLDEGLAKVHDSRFGLWVGTYERVMVLTGVDL